MTVVSRYVEALTALMQPKSRVFDYGSEEAFRHLWGAGLPHKDGIPGQDPVNAPSAVDQPLVVVWDGTAPVPSADKRQLVFLPHLEPLDWALIWSLRWLSRCEYPANAPLPESAPRIGIVDLRPLGRSQAWSQLFQPQLLAAMPWVHVYRPLADPPEQHRGAPLVASDKSWGGPLLVPQRLPESPWKLAVASNVQNSVPISGKRERLLRGLEVLQRLWLSALSEGEEHHDINDLMGPLLLSVWQGRQSEVNAAPPYLRAMLSRCQAGPLADPTAGPEAGAALTTSCRILAVDDHLDGTRDGTGTGWGDVLEWLICGKVDAGRRKPMPLSLETPAWNFAGKCGKGSYKLQFHGLQDPTALLPALGVRGQAAKATIDVAPYTIRRFDSPLSSPAGEQVEAPWLMLLDLRLFSGTRSRAAEWHLTLAKAALSLHDHASKLAWNAFGADLPSLRSWLKPDGASSPDNSLDEAIALTLLPRLCALRWPTTPILIFSSTRRRDVIERLALCRNIFFAGAKPNLAVAPTGLSLQSFRLKWLERGGEIERVLQAQQKFRRLELARVEPVEARGESHAHVTVAIDESGNFRDDATSTVTAAVCIARASSAKAALSTYVSFADHLRCSGVAFVEERPFYPETEDLGGELPAGSNIKEKDNDIHRKSARDIVIDAVMKSKCRSSITFGLGRLRIGRADYLTEDNPAAGYRRASSGSESTYIKAVSDLLEIILAEYIPGMVGDQENLSISLYFPSKQTSHPDQESAKKSAFLYDRLFVGGGDAHLVETLGGYGVAPLLLGRSIEGRHNHEKIMNSVLVVQTRKIPYASTAAGGVRNFYCRYCKKSFFNREGVPTNENCRDLGTWQFREGREAWVEGPCSRREKAAEYTPLAHVADLFSGLRDNLLVIAKESYHQIRKSSFDSTYSPALRDFLSVSRDIDTGALGPALSRALANDFFLGGIPGRGDTRAPVHHRIVSRLKTVVRQSRGAEILDAALR